MVRRWGLAVWVTFAALLVGVSMFLRPELRANVLGASFIGILGVWAPVLVGGVVAWGLVSGFGDRDMLDRRVVAAMEGHPIHRELAWLFMFLGSFLAFLVVLSWMLAVYEAEIGADLAMSASLVSRLLFLFTMPMLVMDRSGVTISGKGTAMPSLALAAREPWRWLGLVPVAIALSLASYLIIPQAGLSPLSLSLIGFVLAFALIAVCEEIFFRSMMQTRLELLLGRWSGIVATSVVFALTYAVIQPFEAVALLHGADPVYDIGFSLIIYGAVGLFYGYLWSCFRNTWINVIMRIGMFVIFTPLDLRTDIS